MKKIKLALLVVLALATMMFTACGHKCDICGKSGADNEVSAFGETAYFCDDCVGK